MLLLQLVWLVTHALTSSNTIASYSPSVFFLNVLPSTDTGAALKGMY